MKDVVAHLLDTQLRRLAVSRHPSGSKTLPNTSDEELLSLVNRLNEEGVRKYGQLSPRELISRMEAASEETCEYLQALDPFAPALFPVSWAGEQESANWFDIAREFTERWHHQQQIRVAVERPGIMTRELYHPVLDCFMRALPYSYRTVSAHPGALAQFEVSGECGGKWFLYRHGDNWALNASPVGDQVSRTAIPQEIAWRIFTKGISRDAARDQVQVSGDSKVGLHILGMLSIIG